MAQKVRIGEKLVQYGYINKEQLENALSLQKGTAKGKKLGEILVEQGLITPEILKPILKTIGIISPLRQLFFKNAYGHVIHDKTNIIISSGVTKASHKNKFRKLDPFFAREITIIDVKS